MPLDHWMEPTGIEELDRDFKEASDVIAHLESVRVKCVDDFDELVIATGASAYKTPDVEKCLTSFFVVAEHEHPEFMKGVETGHEAPFFTHKAKLSSKTQKIHDQIVKFIKGYKEIEKPWCDNCSRKLKELEAKLAVAELEKQIADKYKDKKGELSKFCVALKRNQEKIKLAVACDEHLKAIDRKHSEQLKYPESEHVILQVPKWVEKAKKEKLCQPYDIVFTNLTPEEREGLTSKCGLCKWQTKVAEKRAIKNKLAKLHPTPKAK